MCCLLYALHSTCPLYFLILIGASLLGCSPQSLVEGKRPIDNMEDYLHKVRMVGCTKGITKLHILFSYVKVDVLKWDFLRESDDIGHVGKLKYLLRLN